MKTSCLIPIAAFAIISSCLAGETTNSLHPKEYSDLHIGVLDSKSAKWADSRRRLGRVGAALPWKRWKGWEAQNRHPTGGGLHKQRGPPRGGGVAKEDVQPSPRLIQMRLER